MFSAPHRESHKICISGLKESLHNYSTFNNIHNFSNFNNLHIHNKMVFPLTKVFERRLEHNLHRHRLDASLVAKRPQPCCKPTIFKQASESSQMPVKTADQELMDRFIEQVTVQPAPVIVEPEIVKPEILKPAFNQGQKALNKDLDKDYFQPQHLHRVGSVESNVYTESESDCSI
ncbi:unnamed protein product [Bursaphelenchus okinawaensis]|uniref:Uncharacterized protein n=1 Tax=Bursaphelenchus okinawaensis TaxID=465554 RepID=A0A811LLK3_9BILA|nr:unnamed protein product [Bursaphelenchus okinawaensis]CAG9125870.1 unnamed protein product [Bursaphelenchus okinawaensis]